MPVPQSLRYGAFDAKKKRDIEDEERARANPWPNHTPDVAAGSRKVSEPIFTGLGGSRESSPDSGVTNTISGAMDESPITEMEALKSRFGYGSAAVDEERNAQARQNFLSNPTQTGIRDYVPEGGSGGDYLKIMSRDAQNRSIRDSNENQIAMAEMARARQEADIQNALRQEAAHQKMAIEAEDAKRMQEFFAATGALPSPQAAQEYLRQAGRQRASSQFMEAIKGLIVQKENEYKRLFQGYENTPETELPAAIRMQAAALDRKYADIENKMAMAAGMQAGTNNPGNMADKENNPPIY